MELTIGQAIKGYELRERIGAGGFGAVYRAYQSSVGREVAIKIILPRVANHPDFIRRFETEAQLIARLEHPYIVPLYDYWRDPNGAYLVMRFLRGGSLRDALQQGPLATEMTALFLDQITSALAIAHRNQIIHRDLKPANILLDEDGNAYLADFGIAKDTSNLIAGATEADVIIGSPDYLAPEQARSDPVSPQTDIYSLGVMLYEVLTGEHPFPNVTPVERMYKHLNDPLPFVTNLTEIATEVNEVIQKATAKNPAHRYSDALALASAFREAVGLNRTRSHENVVELLTQREQEVLQLLIQGRANKEIAQALYITLPTVKWYVTQIFHKLHVRSRVQAIVRARELNLVVTGGHANGHTAITGSQAVSLDVENPYKGLRAFQSADSRDFFGRERLTQKLLQRMGETSAPTVGQRGADKSDGSPRFLAVVGPSGSGKSSLVKAGLIPALWRGDLPGSERWFLAEMLPGAHPLDELEIALIKIAANHTSNLHEQLQRDERGLLRVAQLILPNDGSELMLVVDQFEEVFTLVSDEAERAHFLNILVESVSDPRSRVRLVITLRADFYDRPLHYPAFGELVRTRMETILPLSAEELERAIAKPAEQVGIKFEPGLVATIVGEVNYQPGALPLLQYALTELFERREGRLLTHEAYQAIGGTVGALAKRADEIYDGLTDAGKEAARQMFLRLVTLGEGVEDTRRRVVRAELLAMLPSGDTQLNGDGMASEDLMDDLIDTYAAYRLLSLDHDPSTRTPTVEVAHEAILREWEQLRKWLNESRDEIRLQRQLAAMAAEWRQANLDASFLARGSRLEQFEQWAQDTGLALTQRERDYLDASLHERERQQAEEATRQAREAHLERRAVQGLRLLVAVFALAAVVAIALTVFAFDREAQSRTNFVRAERIRLAAQAQIALDQGEDVRIPALLAMRSLELGYSPEADAALLTALSRSSARQIYVGHTDGIATVAFSPDGRTMLSGGVDLTIRLWDTRTGEELRQFLGHYGLVNRVVFTPDGHYAVSVSTDGTARQWDVATGEEVRRLLEQGNPLFALALSPDGRYLATSDDSGSAQLWDFETMELVREFIGHTDTIDQVAFSPDGRYLATGSFDRSARLWEVATGEEVQIFEGHAACACWVDFSPDGRLLVTAGYDATARLWDVSTGEEVRRFIGHTNTITSAEFSPDGRWVVTAGRTDLSIRLWDVETGQELRRLMGHTSEVSRAAFSPDGRFVLSASTDNTARLWDLSLESEPKVFENPLAAVHANAVVMAVLSGDNRRVITANSAGMIQFWDRETRQVVHEFGTDNGGFINDAQLSPDGRFVMSPGGDGVVRVWDVETGEKVREYNNGQTGALLALEYSPDGDSFLTGDDGGMALLWEVSSGEVLQHFDGHEGSINSVSFSSDKRFVATASDDATARLWDAETGNEIRRLVGHTGAVLSVAFSPDDQFVLTGGEDNTARLWDTQTGEEVRQFVGHILPVRMVAFSPDGRWVITAGLDQTARIWDIATGEVIRQFVGHESSLRSVSMSSDGQFLLTGDLLAAYLWRVDLQDVIQLACTRLAEDFSPEERARYVITDDRRMCADLSSGAGAADAVWTPIPTQPIPVWTPLPPHT